MLSTTELKGVTSGTSGESMDLEALQQHIRENKLTTITLGQVKVLDAKAEAKEIKSLSGHSSVVNALAVLPDGTVASGSLDKTIKLWDIKSGACVKTLSEHRDPVFALAILPNGTVASGSGDYTIKLWDPKSGACVKTLSGHSNVVSELAVLPDGTVASGSDDNTIKLWDIKSETCVKTLSGHNSRVSALAVLPDGTVASGYEDATIKLWDPKKWFMNCVKTLSGHRGGVWMLAVLPDGTVASGSQDGTIKLWNVKSGVCVKTLSEHWGYVSALAALPDGRVASGSWDKTIKLWDIKSETCVKTLSGHRDYVSALAVLPDGTVASGSRDNTIKLWDVNPRRALLLAEILNVITLLKTNRSVTHLNLQETAIDDSAVSALIELCTVNITLLSLDLQKTAMTDAGLRKLYEAVKLHKSALQIQHEAMAKIEAEEKAKIAAEAARKKAEIEAAERAKKEAEERERLRKEKEAQEQERLRQEAKKNNTLGKTELKAAISEPSRSPSVLETLQQHIRENKLMTIALGQVKVLDEKAQAKEIKSLSGHSVSVCTLSVLLDGTVASGSEDNTIRLWDPKSGACVKTLSRHSGPIYALAALPNGTVASGSSDKTIKLWDIKTGMCVKTLSGHSSTVYALAILPDGTVASGSKDKTIKLWDVKSGTCMKTLSGHNNDVRALAILPDGTIASGSWDKTIKLWDVKSGAYVKTLGGHESAVLALAVLPDGTIASGSADRTIKLWDVKSGACVKTLSGVSHFVYALAVLPDGTIAIGSGDWTIKLWDPKSGACMKTLSGHGSQVLALAILPDGTVASGSLDSTIKLWDINPPRALLLAEIFNVITLLKTNRSVTHLNLQETAIDDNAIPALIELCTVNTTLLSLDLQKTVISEVGLRKLYEAVKLRKPMLQMQHEGMAKIEAEEQAKIAAEAVRKKAEMEAAERVKKEAEERDRLQKERDKEKEAREQKQRQALEVKTSSKIASISIPNIPWSELKIGDAIGNGSYGDVYQGQWRGKEVAIKLLQLKTLQGPVAREFERETEIMWSCRATPNIVSLEGICTEPGHFAMVMEYMPKSLRDRLQDEKDLPWTERWQIAIGIAEGLRYLHSRGIVHRDLKSFNILLDALQTAKIGDFGLAKVKLEVSGTKSKGTGSVRWRAPELFKPDAVSTPAADVYSLGMLLLELATRRLPFAHAHDDLTVALWISQGTQEKIPADCPKALADIIRACWAEPDKRPSAEEVVARLRAAQVAELEIERRLASERKGVVQALSVVMAGQQRILEGVQVIHDKQEITLACVNPPVPRGLLDVDSETTVSPTRASSTTPDLSLSAPDAKSTTKTELKETEAISAFKKKLIELLTHEEGHFTFLIKRRKNNSLVIQFTAADSVLIAPDEIRIELTALVKLMKAAVNDLEVKAEQYKVEPNWKDWTLTLTAEPAILDKIGKLLRGAGAHYFPPIAKADAVFFSASASIPSASSAEPQLEQVTCLVQ